MNAAVFAAIALPLFAAACGLSVFELALRRFSSAQRISEESERACAQAVPAGRARRALSALSRRVERIMPLALSQSHEYRDRLEKAGLRLEPETWRAVRLLAALGCLALAAALCLPAAFVSLPVRCALVAAAGVVGWAAPKGYLAAKTKRRRAAIDAQLPDAMELIGIAVAAGSPVEQCFREVADTVDQPLAEELSLIDREVNLLGHSREQALEKFARRCESQEVAAFVAQLTQAISQGSSIAEGLSSQAQLARDTAHAAVIERIRTMPVKLDIVLSFCFLPPTIALVVVPTVVSLLAFLNDTMQ